MPTERKGRLALAEQLLRGKLHTLSHATNFNWNADAQAIIREMLIEAMEATALRLSPVMAGMRDALAKIVGLAAKRRTDHTECHCTVCQMRDISEAALSAPHPQTRGEDVDLTNHHNALKCPYCNPDGLVLARPSEATAGREARLTAQQREFLLRVSRETFSDNSGRGLLLHDGRDIRMAERLLERGFVTNAVMMPFNGPKITPAGREALADAIPASRNGVDADGADRK